MIGPSLLRKSINLSVQLKNSSIDGFFGFETLKIFGREAPWVVSPCALNARKVPGFLLDFELLLYPTAAVFTQQVRKRSTRISAGEFLAGCTMTSGCRFFAAACFLCCLPLFCPPSPRPHSKMHVSRLCCNLASWLAERN